MTMGQINTIQEVVSMFVIVIFAPIKEIKYARIQLEKEIHWQLRIGCDQLRKEQDNF